MRSIPSGGSCSSRARADGQDHDRSGPRVAARDDRQARPGVRGRRQGRPRRRVRGRLGRASTPSRSPAGPSSCRWTPRPRSASTSGSSCTSRSSAGSARSRRRSTSSPPPHPGVREILTVGKLCYEVRERPLRRDRRGRRGDRPRPRHLTAPQAINDLVRVGLIRSQTDWMLDLLADADTTGVVVVATPEEMPVAESIELIDVAARRPPASTSRRSS